MWVCVKLVNMGVLIIRAGVDLIPPPSSTAEGCQTHRAGPPFLIFPCYGADRQQAISMACFGSLMTSKSQLSSFPAPLRHRPWPDRSRVQVLFPLLALLLRLGGPLTAVRLVAALLALLLAHGAADGLLDAVAHGLGRCCCAAVALLAAC